MQATQTEFSRSDRVGLGLTIGISLLAAGLVIAMFVRRLLEIIPNSDVPVLLPFVDTEIGLPVGPEGTAVESSVESAIVPVSGMPGITLFSLIAGPAVEAVATVIVVISVCLLCRNFMRGIAFSGANTRLITVTGVTIAIAWGLSVLFETMGVNGAFATVSDYSYDNLVAEINFTPFLAVLGIGAVALAFQAGEKMGRDTEGLV